MTFEVLRGILNGKYLFEVNEKVVPVLKIIPRLSTPRGANET